MTLIEKRISPTGQHSKWRFFFRSIFATENRREAQLLLQQHNMYVVFVLLNNVFLGKFIITFGRTLLILYTGIFLSTTSVLLLLPPPDDDADEQVLLARVKFLDRRFGSLTDFLGTGAPTRFLMGAIYLSLCRDRHLQNTVPHTVFREDRSSCRCSKYYSKTIITHQPLFQMPIKATRH